MAKELGDILEKKKKKNIKYEKNAWKFFPTPEHINMSIEAVSISTTNQ